VLAAEQDERRRLERNLHDGAQQRLISLSLDLKRLEGRLGDDHDAQAEIDQARSEIATSLEELRTIARGLHPAVLTDHGLGAAIDSLAERAPLPVEIEVALDGRLPAPVEAAAYFVASEALANVAKHSQATKARVTARRRDGRVEIVVEDDGIGGARSELGSGLRGLADRVEALGGELKVESPDGGGTRIVGAIPCAS
jgi:signal transduction histidine kinase